MISDVNEFESLIAEYYGAKYCVATDCCTHGIELALRYTLPKHVNCVSHTYLSVPFVLEKLNLKWEFENVAWENYYTLGNTNIIDGAVYWKENGYIPGTFFCLSFQYKKHLNLGRGGAILCDNHKDYLKLKAMAYDGRDPFTNMSWKEQQISTVGYHYYMTPETAAIGKQKFEIVKNIPPKLGSWMDYPYLPIMPVFLNIIKNKSNSLLP